ncbi:unnamed protein product, partial [Brassica oleracea var. botrytis]
LQFHGVWVCGPSSEFPLSSYEVSGLVLSFGGQGSSDKCGCMRSGGYRVASQRQQRHPDVGLSHPIV